MSPPFGRGQESIYLVVPALRAGTGKSERACKPGSVVNDHLSVAHRCRWAQAASSERPGRPVCSSTALLRIEFTAPACLHAAGELLPRLSTLTAPKPVPAGKVPPRRYISVALVRGSPLAGVTRYPCPVEPGLSSRAAFRPAPAVVQPARKADFTRRRRICQPKILLPDP